ncbi:outer membrane beta-barrel protein [Vibrio vulnificus]|nr:outer membrane beta-barrel protein [Vibrio vulnificus]
MKSKILAAAVLFALSAHSFADDKEATRKPALSIGFAKSSIEVGGYDFPDDAYGFNSKYRTEVNNTYGFITSASYSRLSEAYFGQSINLSQFSITAGPVFRANDRFSFYGLIGVGFGYIETNYGDDDETSLALGAGAQFDISDEVVFDISYETASYSGDIDVGTWSIGLGYRF